MRGSRGTGAQGLRVPHDCSPHPPSGFRGHATSSFPAAPLRSPHRLLPERSFAGRSQLPPRLFPKGPSCLFVLALLGRDSPAHCPWRRGEGSLANKGRSQVEAPGRGGRRGCPTSPGRGRPQAPPPPARLSPPPPSPPMNSAQR